MSFFKAMLSKLVSLVSDLFKTRYEKLAEARFRSILQGKVPPKQCFSCGASMLTIERDNYFSRRNYYLCPKCGARQDIYGVVRQIRLPYQPKAKPESEEDLEAEIERY